MAQVAGTPQDWREEDYQAPTRVVGKGSGEGAGDAIPRQQAEHGQGRSPTRLVATLLAVTLLAIVALLFLPNAIERIRPHSHDASAESTIQAYSVGNTDGEGVYLHRTPRRGDALSAYPEGTLLERAGEDVTGREGWTWHRIRTPDGVAGWVPAQFTIEAR